MAEDALKKLGVDMMPRVEKRTGVNVKLNDESIEVLDRFKSAYGHDKGKVIDAALKLFDARFKPAREYQQRLEAAKERESAETENGENL